MDPLELALGADPLSGLMVEHRAILADLVQKRLRAILAAAVGQREHVDGRIGQAQRSQRLAAIEQDRRIERGVVFHMHRGAHQTVHQRRRQRRRLFDKMDNHFGCDN